MAECNLPKHIDRDEDPKHAPGSVRIFPYNEGFTIAVKVIEIEEVPVTARSIRAIERYHTSRWKRLLNIDGTPVFFTTRETAQKYLTENILMKDHTHEHHSASVV